MSNASNSVSTHPSGEALRAYAAGSLAAPEAAALEAHLGACTECCEFLAALPPDSFQGVLRQAYDPAELPTRPDGSTPRPDWGAAEPAAALPQLPGYEVRRELGRGGMGVVYEAADAVMGRRVAVKVIHPELLRHPVAALRFRREVRAAARLAHPNLVTAFDAGQADSCHFLAMELIEGENLADLLQRAGPLPVAQACDLVRQAALGLQHAHEAGLVHRDVKPHNLMRAADGTVKVLDFGLAALAGDRAASGATAAGAVMGTPDYMAPEQAEDARAADARADVYALGCTLFHLLTGRPVFPRATVMQKLLAHQEEAPTSAHGLRPEVPASLDALLLRALAKRPEQRFGSAGELAEALRPFADPNRPAETGAPAGRRRWRRLLTGIGVSLLLAALGAAVVFHLPAGKERALAIPSPSAPAAAFREVHGADEKGFMEWVDAVTKDGFRPVSLSVRAGSDQPRFNGIAVRDGRDLPTTVRVGMSGPEPLDYFRQMCDRRYRVVASCLYVDGGLQKQAHIYVKDGVSFRAWGHRLDLLPKILTENGTNYNMMPIYLSTELQTQGSGNVNTVFAPDGGLAWWARHGVSADDLRAEVEDWRGRDWRPTFLNAYKDGDRTRFLTVARENRAGLDWDCRWDLPEAAYEDALKENERRGLRPAAVASYLEGDEVRYAAVWEPWQSPERAEP
jgi:tRNA A-37 threonylcarbamoyl transferase component Bud32